MSSEHDLTHSGGDARHFDTDPVLLDSGFDANEPDWDREFHHLFHRQKGLPS